jgi:hypothetical protein
VNETKNDCLLEVPTPSTPRESILCTEELRHRPCARLRKGKPRPRKLLVRTEPAERKQMRLSARDSGVGFTPQAADKIFEAFYTTKTDGMGMGLSISRSIIEAHQGRLWATPNEGPGSTFSFAVPCTVERLTACHGRRAWNDAETHVNPAEPSRKAA